MAAIELALALLLAVLVSGYVVRALPIHVPLPIVQITLGWVISNRLHQGVELQPEVFFLLFLPPLLFVDGWRISKDGLLRDKGAILQLAFGLVVFTVLGAGYLIHWLIPAMPLAVAFALAAILPYHLDYGAAGSTSSGQASIGAGLAFGWGDVALTWRQVWLSQHADSSILKEVTLSGPSLRLAWHF